MDFITKLPNEVLIEIFEYCKILPLTQTCKKFNEIIRSTPILMKRLYLIISEKTDASELVNSERKHQSVYFKFNYRIRDSCMNVLSSFPIRNLELVRCIVKAELFSKMLGCLPHLENLSIFTTYLKEKDNIGRLELPQLPKLISLNFRNSDVDFLKLLRHSKIETLSMLLPVQYPPSDLSNFLKTQPSISTIEYLNVSGIDDTLMTLITQEMSELKTLHLEIDRLNMDIIRNLELRNYCVERLNISGNPPQVGDLNLVLSYFKKLKSLEIEMNNFLEPVNFAQLQQLSPKLETLAITHCSGDFLNHIQLRNLKKLRLTDGRLSVEGWTRLAHRNPYLESLVIKDEAMTDEIFRIICLEFRHLKHFETFYDPELTSDILDFIADATFPSNISFLKITQRAAPGTPLMRLTDEQKKTLNTKLGFRFIFN